MNLKTRLFVISVSDLTLNYRFQKSEHINEKMIKLIGFLVYEKKFQYIWTKTLILLYKAMVKPHLEYANSVWCPYKKGDIAGTEKIQKSHKLGYISTAPYIERLNLRQLKLPTWKYRRLRGDMIEVSEHAFYLLLQKQSFFCSVKIGN